MYGILVLDMEQAIETSLNIAVLVGQAVVGYRTCHDITSSLLRESSSNCLEALVDLVVFKGSGPFHAE